MLFAPMIFMVLYIITLGLATFLVRFKAIKSKQLHYAHFKVYDTKNYDVPERIIRFGRHFDNQFQVPMLFLITCVVARTTPLMNNGALPILAWSFVATRIIHTYIHLGANNVRHRALSFFAGCMIVGAMWIYIAIQTQV